MRDKAAGTDGQAVGPSLETVLALRRQIEAAGSRAERSRGRYEEHLARLREEFDLSSAAEARKESERAAREGEKYGRQSAEAEAEFRAEYTKLLEDER